jgi:hypothetical protein
MKNIYHTVGTVPTIIRKIVEIISFSVRRLLSITFHMTNFGFIVCYDIDNVHIEIISIQKLINIDCRKLVEILELTLKK